LHSKQLKKSNKSKKRGLRWNSQKNGRKLSRSGDKKNCLRTPKTKWTNAT